MKFDVYCDETFPDLFCSQKPSAKFMVIGSLWFPSEYRAELKQRIHFLRDSFLMGPEFKWRNISPSRLPFYLDLVEMFLSFDNLMFRCIAVEAEKVNLELCHRNDDELGFYSFYFHMLTPRLAADNQYAIFCDQKVNRVRLRLDALQSRLQRTNPEAQVAVQAIRSHESVLLQLTDVLTGAAAARMNKRLHENSAKSAVVASIEKGLGRPIGPTFVSENKFNVFQIKL